MYNILQRAAHTFALAHSHFLLFSTMTAALFTPAVHICYDFNGRVGCCVRTQLMCTHFVVVSGINALLQQIKTMKTGSVVKKKNYDRIASIINVTEIFVFNPRFFMEAHAPLTQTRARAHTRHRKLEQKEER